MNTINDWTLTDYMDAELVAALSWEDKKPLRRALATIVENRYQTVRAALKEIFKELRKEKVIAKMNYKCCMSCASYAIGEDLDKRTDMIGTVYWHRQDEDGFKERGKLMLRYFHRDDDKCREIADLIIAKLKAHKVPFKWDGNTSTCIQVG